MRKIVAAILFLVIATPALSQKAPPYWGSIDEPEARLRTGPSTEYPTMWIYQRERLPVKILKRYQAWRKIEDIDGAQGWMHARLLSGTQTAIVTGDQGQIHALRSKPKPDGKVIWRVEVGVVGVVTQCANGWCLFDVTGRQGYIEQESIWGDEPLK